MIRITIPNNNIAERKYIISVLFKEYLGVEFLVEVSKKDHEYYVLILNNGNVLRIKDHFFSKYDDCDYLVNSAFPTAIEHCSNGEFSVENIPVIYGTGDIKTNPKQFLQKDKICCDVDIFASCFFMLTRWEEYVNKARDVYGRFPAKESLAYKFDFMHRPIVNEYVELLWSMLKALDSNIKRKDRRFRHFITHDIDIPTIKSLSIYKAFKKMFYEFFFRSDPSAATRLAWSWICENILHLNNDIYVTYDWLMSFSELLSSKSHFYFMASDQSRYDPGFNDDSLKLVSHYSSIINKRGHKIGYHPSYVSFDKNESWNAELTFLRTIIRSPISGGRQHYLRFEVPRTWHIWDKSGLEYDASLGYPETPGFRCGTCYEYPVFDFLTKQKLDLVEYPLIVMDSSIFKRGYNEPSVDMLKKYIAICKKFNGNFVFLLHNTEPITEKRRKILTEAFSV